ncbi:hypothetical protein HOF92_03485 [bacterium]|jgi:hypothetical protein|nr:hypothetical protein [bacterium]
MINFHKTLDRHEGKSSYMIQKKTKKKGEVSPTHPTQKLYSELGIGAQLNFSV